MKRSEVIRRVYRTGPVGPSPRASSARVSQSMKSNKASGTKPERTLSALLKRPLRKSRLPGRPDFVFPRARLTVFVHGDWWHQCPTCNISLPKRHRNYWKRKLERNVERDKLNRTELESQGWRVLVVWEHEVKKDPIAAALRIRSAVADSRPKAD